MRIDWLTAAVVALSLIPGLAPAAAEQFPTKPISIVVPFTAGGPTDTIARFVNEILTKEGITAIVENKPGGNTLVGIRHTLRQPADGYTLFLATSPFTANQILRKEPGYKLEDFVAVAPLATQAGVLFASEKLKITSLPELLAYAHQNPGKLNIGTVGASQVLSNRFIEVSKLNFKIIPYKGASEIITGLMTGDIHLAFLSYAAGASYVNDGKIKPIAVVAEQRSTVAPDIPTFKELGMDGLGKEGWIALFARADTSPPLIARLRKVMVDAVNDPAYLAKIRSLMSDPWAIEPEKIDEYIRADLKFWEPDLRRIEPQ